MVSLPLLLAAEVHPVNNCLLFGHKQSAGCKLAWYIQHHTNSLGEAHSTAGHPCVETAQRNKTTLTHTILLISKIFNRQVLVHSWHAPRATPFHRWRASNQPGLLGNSVRVDSSAIRFQIYTLQMQLNSNAPARFTVAELALVLGKAESEPRPLPCTAPGTGARICSNQPEVATGRAGAKAERKMRG
jgi:hypothetical protein